TKKGVWLALKAGSPNVSTEDLRVRVVFMAYPQGKAKMAVRYFKDGLFPPSAKVIYDDNGATVFWEEKNKGKPQIKARRLGEDGSQSREFAVHLPLENEIESWSISPYN